MGVLQHGFLSCDACALVCVRSIVCSLTCVFFYVSSPWAHLRAHIYHHTYQPTVVCVCVRARSHIFDLMRVCSYALCVLSSARVLSCVCGLIFMFSHACSHVCVLICGSCLTWVLFHARSHVCVTLGIIGILLDFSGLPFCFVSQQGDCLTCNSGSPTKRLLRVTDMDSGRRIHVPAS